MSSAIRVGDRVRLSAPWPGLTLRSDLGTVEALDESTGCWLVRLDAQASYVDTTGQTVRLTVIRETGGNLVKLRGCR